MKHFVLSILFFLLANIVSAQVITMKDSAELHTFSKHIADLFEKNEIAEAFDELALFWPLPQNEIDAAKEKSIKSLNMVAPRFGKAIGHIKINEKSVQDFILAETYLVRYEYHAIRLKFLYYRNDEGWIVNGFTWDDGFKEELR